MPAGRHNAGPLWVDGSIALRVRDKKQRAWRMVRVRRPYAVLGRHPAADLVIDRPGVLDHHVFLFLDGRGLFGVDLRTESGTRFAGTDAEACWLGSGDLIELGDHVVEVVQLRVNGAVLAGPLSDDDPLGLIEPGDAGSRGGLTLRPLADPYANWSIGSSLVFLGRGPACAVRLGDATIGPTHSAILRDGPAVYLAQFPGATARLNDRPAPVAVRLADSDVLAIGTDSLLVRTHDLPNANSPASPPPPSVSADGNGSFHDLATRFATTSDPTDLARAEFLFESHHTTLDPTGPIDYPALIGRLQAETAALVAVLLRRIEALDDEMATLRARMDADERLQTQSSPPVEKLRWDLIPPSDTEAAPPERSGRWLVDRLRELEAERRTVWSNLVGRVNPGRTAD